MAKLKDIYKMYYETLDEITSNEENWRKFLETACYNFKYPFKDQVLIYAQKPDALAVTSIDIWNKYFHRWINKDTKAIVLFDDTSQYKMKLVFDIQDTNQYGKQRPYTLWIHNNKNNQAVIDRFSSNIEDISTIKSEEFKFAIEVTTYNLIQQNLIDYLDEFKTYSKGTILENLSYDEIANKILNPLANSISYIVLKRCGFNANEYLKNKQALIKFKNVELNQVFGVAVSQLAEKELTIIRDVNKELNSKKLIYTFEKDYNENYNKEKNERSVENGNNIYESERDISTRIGNEESEDGNRKIRRDEEKLFEGTQTSNISNIDDEAGTRTTLNDNSKSSNGNGTTDSREVKEAKQYNREIEERKSNGVARTDEQHSKSSRGDSEKRINLQLNLFDEPITEVEQKNNIQKAEIDEKSSAFSFSQEMIDNCIKEGSGFVEGKFRIERQFERSYSETDNAEFLKKEYGIGGSSSIRGFENISLDYDSKGITLNNRDNNISKLYSWRVIAKRTKELIKNDEYLTDKEKDEYNNWLNNEYNKENEITRSNEIVANNNEIIEKSKTITDKNKINLKVGQEIYLEDDRKYRIEAYNRELDQIIMMDMNLYEQAHYPVTRDDKYSRIVELYKNNTRNFNKSEIEAIKENVAKISNKEDNHKVNDNQENIKEDKINFHITDENLGVGTPKEKYENNIEAIKTLKKIETENRLATKEEQNILSRYVGWGGLADYFDKNKHPIEYEELKNLLTEEEFEKANESTLTAFYTPPVVIKSIYKALENMGLDNANILEPSCGIGNFIGLLPNELENKCKIYGVELDSISGRVAKQLYQKQNIQVTGFENAKLQDSFFDVAIGNVPFGDFKVIDKKYADKNFLIHDYFFAKALDKVRPGGIIAFITSKGTMDKKSPEFRKYLSQRAELIGAIRLPDNTFKKNAGTKVTSDIIFLKKRDRELDVKEDWQDINTDSNGIIMNQYFIDNPQMVLGNMEQITTQFGFDSACKDTNDDTLENKLLKAIENLNATIKEYQVEDIEDEKEEDSIIADPNVKNYSYTIIDDKVYYRVDSRMKLQDDILPQNTIDRIKGMVRIRDITRELLKYELEDYPTEDINSKQRELNEIYDRFIKQYDVLNSDRNKKAFIDDSSYNLLASLENFDNKTKQYVKADIFTKRTIKPHKVVTRVDTADEALTLSISEKAKVDLDYMQQLTNKSKEDLVKDLRGVVFKIPGSDNEYQTADEYLSGNIREKLKIAQNYADNNPGEYEVNVRALQEVLPKDLTPADISVRLGSTWIKPEYYEQFMYELLDTPSYLAYDRTIGINYSNITGEWQVQGKSQDRYNIKSSVTYGTERASAYKIIEDTLNLRTSKVYDYEIDPVTGNKVQILNKTETAIACQKQEQIKQTFLDWIWNDQARREDLLKTYNEMFNSNRDREYDGSHLNLEGMNGEIKLRKHQLNAIARILYGGNTLLAHEVGAGKTFEMVAAAMECKRLGLCTKSLFVVPNHIIEQFASDFYQLYPNANILVATKKDFQKENRRKFCSKIATGDYDAIIIGHSQFEKIPVSKERQIKIIKKQIQEIIDGIENLKYERGQNFTVKQLAKTKKKLEVKLNKIYQDDKKDDVITFEELGVDRLFVDEAHYYKNLYLYTKMRNVAGISQTESQKSSDLYMKCQYLDEITNGKGIIFATGTPVSNSMTELYTMQKYLQSGTLRKKNLESFDSWASTFGETVTSIELSPEGSGYRPKTRFSKFFNLPELMTMVKDFADIQTADTLNLPVPKANFHNVVVKPSDEQVEMVKSLSERADKVRNNQVSPRVDNLLKITNDGRKLALDQRLINELLPNNPNSKSSICADNVYKIWNDTKDKKSAQLIFCDLSTPSKDKFNVYDDIKEKLISKGIPESEIEFIHNADTEIKKEKLFEKVRNGEVRVLIGSTQKMGAGTNVQQKLIALHDLDVPWRPADLQQRLGRIVRQGNENKEVEVFRYVTEKTFDAYSYQLLQKKQEFISQIMTSKTPVRTSNDVDESVLSYAEIKALAAGNPLIIEKTQLESELSKYRMLKSSYYTQIYSIQDKVAKFYPQEINRLENLIEGYKKDIELVKNNTKLNKEDFSPMELNGHTYENKKEAGQKLIEICKSNLSEEKISIGNYKGMEMLIEFDPFMKQYNLYLKNEVSHNVELGTDPLGNITRIDNCINNFEENMKRNQEQLEQTKKQFENAKIEENKPFEKEEEMKKVQERLNQINAELKINENENIIIEDNSEEEREKEFEKSKNKDDDFDLN